MCNIPFRLGAGARTSATRPFFTMLFLGLGTLCFLAGGCSGSASSTDNSTPEPQVLGIQQVLDSWLGDDPATQPSNDTDDGSGNTANSTDGSNDGDNSDDTGTISVSDETVGAVRGVARVIRLQGNSSAGKPLTFTIVTPPQFGALSEIHSLDANTAEVTYTSPSDFIGTTQFSFQATDGTVTSDPGTISLIIYPEIRFTVEPVDGPRDLTIHAYAFTTDGSPLPEALYNWTWDGTGERSAGMGLSDTTYKYTRGGLHLVSLTVSLLGLPAYPCTHGGTGDLEVQITVWPTIMGQLFDADGNPLENVVIAAKGTNISALTDGEGYYALNVPYDWSGTVQPLDETHLYSPAERTYTNLRADLTSQDFKQLGSGGGDSLPEADAQSVELNEDSPVQIQLTGHDAAGNPLAFWIQSLPSKGALSDNGHEIAAGELPYVLQSNGGVIYTPQANYNGPDEFAFYVSNGQHDSAPATVTLNVLPQSDGPIIRPEGNQTINVEQDSHENDPGNRLDLTGEDPDSASPNLTWQLTDPPHGRAFFGGGSQTSTDPSVAVFYEPDANFLGTDSFNVELRDDNGGTTSITVTVYVGSFPITGITYDYKNSAMKDVTIIARDLSGQITAVTKTDLAGGYTLLVPPGWSGMVTSDENFQLVPSFINFANVQGAATGANFRSTRNYYVAPGGNDSGQGTLAVPFATIQKGGNVVKPGDTVYIKPGVYKAQAGDNKRVLKLTNIYGTQEYPITVTAFDPANPPVLDGNVGTGNLTAIEIIDSAWINLSRLDIRSYKFAGVDVLAIAGPGACHHITVEYCNVHDKHPNNTSWGYGIRAKGPVHYATFRKNFVHLWSAGIALWENPEQTATSCFVPPRAGNTAPGSPTGGYTADLPENQWSSWEGWTQIAPRWCVIEDNLCYNNTSTSGPQNADNYVTRYSIDCTVRNNIGFNDWSGTSQVIDDNFDMTGATRIQFYGNIAFHCAYLPPYPPVTGSGNGMKIGVRGALDPLVHHNVSFYNYRMGLDMGYSVRPKIYNNTIYYHSSAPEGHHKGGDYGIFFEGLSTLTGVDCVNNVAVQTKQSGIGAQHWVKLDRMDYNCIFNEGTSNYRAAQGPHSRQADPLFNNPGYLIDSNFPANSTIEQKLEYIRGQVRQRFTPKTGSPCLNTGVVVPGVTDGYQGSAPDMGAFEGPF